MTTRCTCGTAMPSTFAHLSGHPTIVILILHKDKSIFTPQPPTTQFFHKNTVGQNLSAQLHVICINEQGYSI